MNSTSPKQGTLFLTSTAFHGHYLKDSSGFTLGNFATVEAAQQWCDENGYYLRLPSTSTPSRRRK